MFTKDKILYFLSYLKKHNGSKGEHLSAIIRTHLSINFGTSYATFINDVEKNGYIRHDPSSSYFITAKGKLFIIQQKILKFLKVTILYFVVPIVVILTFVFQFIWEPEFLTKEKAKKNQMETMDSKSKTLSKKDTLTTKSQPDSL